MRFNLLHIVIVFTLISISVSSCKDRIEHENIFVTGLKCELLENPEGIDSKSPLLSWINESRHRNIQQKAYQILVATSPEKLTPDSADLWNSGKIFSDQSIHLAYKGRDLKSREKCYWKVKTWGRICESEWSKPAYWSMGQLNYKDWSGRWIGFDRDFPWDEKVKFSTLSARYFRKEFKIAKEKTIRSVRAYIIGLGWYELQINGQKIGNQVLAPTPTDYTKNVKYNTFDVTKQVKSGENAVGIILGAGRYSAMRPNYKPYKIKDFGYPKLLFNLYVEYTDGTKDVIRTANNWKGTANGPILSNNEYDGETYDARKEMPGWSSPGFDDSEWIPAEYVQEPRGEFEAQMNENITIKDTVHPISINILKPGVFIMDMGQNMSGWIQMKVKGKQGQKVTLRFAESLQENGELHTRPLRDAKALDTYILKGGNKETWHPIFTYHGFRFVEISGYPGTPKLEDFEGHVVYDDMEQIGHFESSDTLLNQIFENAKWTINSTYKGMPIDCPQRNERMPWLGDRAIGCYGESFVYNNSKLYIKWLDDIQYSQKADGSISDVAPPYFRYYSDNMTWPGTYLFVADMLYQQYGLTKPIKKHYPSMKKWLEYMQSRYLENGIMTKDSYGDWCAPPKTVEEGRGKNANVKYPSALISTAYFYKYLNMMKEFAALSDNNKDIQEYQILADEVEQAFNEKYFHEDSVYYGKKLLTDNLLALAFNLVPDDKRTKLIQSIEEIIEVDNNGHLSVGLVGAQWLMQSLADNGLEDLAFKLATNTTYPSWGNMIENGATTIWELWNANTAAPHMNSQNHVMMLGDLIIWYFENLVGIKSDPENPGFKKIIMQPDFYSELDFVNASYKTPYGTIKSHWKRQDEKIEWNIEVPANTSATILIPKKNENILENDERLKNNYGINKILNNDGVTLVEIGSGTYSFKF